MQNLRHMGVLQRRVSAACLPIHKMADELLQLETVGFSCAISAAFKIAMSHEQRGYRQRIAPNKSIIPVPEVTRRRPKLGHKTPFPWVRGLKVGQVKQACLH